MYKLGYVPNLKSTLSHVEVLGLTACIQEWENENNYQLEGADVDEKFGFTPICDEPDSYAALYVSDYRGDLSEYEDDDLDAIEGLKVVCFALTENHTPILVVKDAAEQHSYFEL